MKLLNGVYQVYLELCSRLFGSEVFVNQLIVVCIAAVLLATILKDMAYCISYIMLKADRRRSRKRYQHKLKSRIQRRKMEARIQQRIQD